MKKRLCIVLISAGLAGCVPEMLDYFDQIGDTNYTLTETDSRSYWIYPTKECGTSCPAFLGTSRACAGTVR